MGCYVRCGSGFARPKRFLRYWQAVRSEYDSPGFPAALTTSASPCARLRTQQPHGRSRAQEQQPHLATSQSYSTANRGSNRAVVGIDPLYFLESGVTVNLPYPRTAQRSISRTFGALPCMRIPTRKTRAAAHAVPIVHANTPTTPTQRCQAGAPTGVACRLSISIGVKRRVPDVRGTCSCARSREKRRSAP